MVTFVHFYLQVKFNGDTKINLTKLQHIKNKAVSNFLQISFTDIHNFCSLEIFTTKNVMTVTVCNQ